MERWEKGILILAMAFLFAMSSFTVALGQEIKIGVIGPMQFVEGIHHWNGAVMAAEEKEHVDLLTTDEKLRGMEVLAKAARGLRTSLCLGVQGKDTADMLIFAKHAEKLAPAAIISPNSASVSPFCPTEIAPMG